MSAGAGGPREAWITGCGLVSALGADHLTTWRGLGDPTARAAAVDSTSYAPFHVHPMVALDIDGWIPRRPDQRSMGPLMRYGCVAAGLALQSAGILGDKALLRETHLIVAAPGGERDAAVDEQILAALDGAEDPERVLAERLTSELRPTLFLAQLPNLFAGNISIVHGVDGSSRTFMGEEPAGVDSVRVAWERLAAGQGDLFLAGAAFNGERQDSLLLYHPAGLLLQGDFLPVWQRPTAGMCLGSMSAFLVVEAREHAEARGARPMARLRSVASDRAGRRNGAAVRKAEGQWDALAPQLGDEPVPVLSTACGAGPATAQEREMLEKLQRTGRVSSVRGLAGALGHGMEAAFPAALVLAATSLSEGRMVPPIAPDCALEAAEAGAPQRIAVSCWGHVRGEALALVEAVA